MAIVDIIKMYFWRLAWKHRAARSAAPEVGELFPDFALTDLEGKAHRLSSPAAERTILWLTNLCEDCRAKVPLLEELRVAAGGKIRILAISLSDNDPKLTQEVASRCGFPLLPDPRDIVANEFGLSHPPQTCPLHNLFILDKDGRVVFRHHLSALGSEAFRALWRAWDL